MSDDVTTPADTPAQAGDPTQAGAEEKKKYTWVRWLGTLAIIVALVVLFLLLRGCASDNSPSDTDQQAGQGAASTATADAIAIENKVYAALRAKTLANQQALTSVVYIARASMEESVTVTIILTEPRAVLAKDPATIPRNIAASCEDVVLAAIPEVDKVTVVDANYVVLGSKER